MVRLGKDHLLGLAAYPRHRMVSVFSGAVVPAHRPRLAGCMVVQNRFQIPVARTPDAPLLRDLQPARLAGLA